MDTPWEFQFTSRAPVWQAGANFDLHAINMMITEPTTSPFYDSQNPPHIGSPKQQSGGNHKRQGETIRQQWFTYLESDNSGHTYEDGSPELTKIDSAYRDDLGWRLQAQPSFEPLPSTDFMVGPDLIPRRSWPADGSRTFVSRCTLLDSTPFFRSSILQRFDHPPRTRYCFYRFAPSEVRF
jgi:hypothetical protein